MDRTGMAIIAGLSQSLMFLGALEQIGDFIPCRISDWIGMDWIAHGSTASTGCGPEISCRNTHWQVDLRR